MSETYIHASALIEDDVVLGKGTKVWVNSQIRKGARLGNDCIISKDTFIDTDVSIGSRCKIQNSVSVYHGVTIGDDVFVGPNVSFTNDKVPRAFSLDWQITKTFVDNGASIGANSTIVCGITVGKYAMIAAGSVVTKDVQPYSLVMGNPAKHYSFVDKMGNKVEGN